jgi:hypothetical protein
VVAAQVRRAIQRTDEGRQVLGQGGRLIIPRSLPGRPLIIAHLASLTGGHAPALPHAPNHSAPLRRHSVQCSLSVTSIVLSKGHAWNESWNDCHEACVHTVPSGRKFGGVCAGGALRAPQRSSLNPRVRGSSPWRRTRAELVFLLYRYPGRWPFPGHVCSAFARQSGPSRVACLRAGFTGIGRDAAQVIIAEIGLPPLSARLGLAGRPALEVLRQESFWVGGDSIRQTEICRGF